MAETQLPGLIDKHYQDYLACQRKIETRIGKKLKDHPVKFGERMARALADSSNFKEFSTDLSLPMRKAHDFYGWMAKNETRGRCRGALYRSKEYMEIPLDKRSGSKLDRREDFGVHIEHTIPINQILKMLWSLQEDCSGSFSLRSLPAAMHERFLTLSVCTALTRREEGDCILPGYNSQHPAFQASYPSNVSDLMNVKPFERYDFSGGLVIYSVLNGAEIDPSTWTLADHIELLASVEIYNWDYLETNLQG